MDEIWYCRCGNRIRNGVDEGNVTEDETNPENDAMDNEIGDDGGTK